MISSAELLATFQEYQVKIDKVNDKHERLVKLSRDITVESKRLIFQLHRTDFHNHNDSHADIAQRMVRLKSQWKAIAKELVGESSHRYLRAYSPGLQEYIEALTLEHYLRTNSLMSHRQLQSTLSFSAEGIVNECSKVKKEKEAFKKSLPSKSVRVAEEREVTTAVINEDVSEPNIQVKTQKHAIIQVSAKEKENIQVKEQEQTSIQVETQANIQDTSRPCIQIHIPLQEYLLGVADMTGEVMRVVVAQIGKVNFEKFASICEFVRLLCDAFESLGWVDKTFSKKMSVMRQSLAKVESALYTYKLRGSEVPTGCLFIPPSIPIINQDCTDNLEDEI